MTYRHDVLVAAEAQGLGPLTALLRRDFDPILEQTGGMVIVLTIRGADGSHLGITETDSGSGFYIVFYKDDEAEGDVVAEPAPLDTVADYVRGYLRTHGAATNPYGLCPQCGGPNAFEGCPQPHPAAVTPAEYADRLAEAFATAAAEEPERFAKVRSWEDLDGVADANDFLQEVDEDLGTLPESFVDPAYVTLTTTAIALVEAWLADVERTVTYAALNEVLDHWTETHDTLFDAIAELIGRK